MATATSAQLESLFGAMAEMEATCARLAAMSMTPIERRRLQNLHDAMAPIAGQDDRDGYTAANVNFHIEIYAGAHNDVLADFTRSLRRRLAPYRRAQFRAEGRLPVRTPSTPWWWRRSWPATRRRRMRRCSTT